MNGSIAKKELMIPSWLSRMDEITEGLKEYTILEDTQVDSEVKEKQTQKDGKPVKETITTKTTKEIFCTPDKSRRKCKTTVEITTERKLPSGSTEVKTDTKISVGDVDVAEEQQKELEEHLAGYKLVGKPEETTETKSEEVTENGKKLNRKTTTTTTTEEYQNEQKKKRIKTTIKTVTEDSHGDGSVVTKTGVQVQLADA